MEQWKVKSEKGKDVNMKVTQQKLKDVLLIEPRIFKDNRGHFLETYQANRYHQEVIATTFVQDNLSYSPQGVVRGLHYQLKQPQGKLVWVAAGEVLDVVVDIRRGSPHFGKSMSIILSSNNYRQLYIPEGFAHGFCVLSEFALFSYKCTDYYNPGDEYGIRWDDPALGINWPAGKFILNDKDKGFPLLKDVPEEHLPVGGAGV
jgi:dTDP-4-dehydrorhamnose 3,5-epimerase